MVFLFSYIDEDVAPLHSQNSPTVNTYYVMTLVKHKAENKKKLLFANVVYSTTALVLELWTLITIYDCTNPTR